MSDQNLNVAPWPQELADVVANLNYRPGWKVTLEHIDRGQDSEGLTLKILSKGYDSYHVDRGENYCVYHYFPVPPAAFNRESWLEWVRDRLIDVETHEVCEFMVVAGERPFAPNHGPGWDPYQVRTLNRVEDAETRFTGEHKPGSQ